MAWTARPSVHYFSFGAISVSSFPDRAMDRRSKRPRIDVEATVATYHRTTTGWFDFSRFSHIEEI